MNAGLENLSQPARRRGEISLGAALLLVLSAALMGIGSVANNGVYSAAAVGFVVAAGVASALAILLGEMLDFPGNAKSWIIALAGIAAAIYALHGIAGFAGSMAQRRAQQWLEMLAVAGSVALGARWRWLALLAMIAVAAVLGLHSIRADPQPMMDVLDFEQRACRALLSGHNPYALRFHSVYSDADNRIYYGPGVVRDGVIQFGFPYPSLSLLLSLPGYLIAGDCRYSDLAATLLSAFLLAAARGGRPGYAAAAMLLFLQSSHYVLRMGYTEPLVLLTFSVVMYCACRWPRGLPFALGLFLASKQYCFIFIPATLLLCQPGNWAQWRRMLATAAAVAFAVTAPLALWNFREFWRAAALWQLVQPFRSDSISVLAWLVKARGWRTPPIWIPLAALVPAIALALWRGVRSPAGFAAACAWIMLLFLIFNKQAFANYYYLAAGMACWAVAAIAAASPREEKIQNEPQMNATRPSASRFKMQI